MDTNKLFKAIQIIVQEEVKKEISLIKEEIRKEVIILLYMCAFYFYFFVGMKKNKSNGVYVYFQETSNAEKMNKLKNYCFYN